MHAPRSVPRLLTALRRRAALAGLACWLLALVGAAPAGAVWRAPVDLSAAGQNANDVRVSIGAQGDAVAVWDRFNGANYIVQSAVRAPDGKWQAGRRSDRRRPARV